MTPSLDSLSPCTSLSQMQPLGLKLSVFTTVLGVPWGHSLSLTHSGAPALSELRVEHIVAVGGCVRLTEGPWALGRRQVTVPSPPPWTQNSELGKAALLGQPLTKNQEDHEEGTLLK